MKMPALRARAIVAGLTALSAAALAGIVVGRAGWWPTEHLVSLKHALLRQPRPDDGVELDVYGRLLSYPGKRSIPCPVQTPRMAVLLVIGQSNAANSGGQRYASRPSTAAVNYHRGSCYVAESPLLGASGVSGEAWTLLANKLVERSRFDSVVLVPGAVGGSAIARWARGGDLNIALAATVDEARTHYRVTHVLFHQGETDSRQGTSAAAYAEHFRSVLSTLREHGVVAPVFACVASRTTSSVWQPDNEVARAQRALPQPAAGVFRGVDTDALLERLDRYDGVHFAASGQDKFAEEWVALLDDHLRRYGGSDSQ